MGVIFHQVVLSTYHLVTLKVLLYSILIHFLLVQRVDKTQVFQTGQKFRQVVVACQVHQGGASSKALVFMTANLNIAFLGV